MRKILLLNGCPSSGKDTIANYIVEKYGYKTLAFKDQAFKDVYTHFGLTEKEYMDMYNDRSKKDSPVDKLGNRSPRKAMQYVVEEINKPKYGKDYLAKHTLEIVLKDVYNNYVISDLGLEEEELAVHLLLEKEKYQIIYISRDGFDFTNDTRSKRNKIDYHIDNNESLEELFKKVDALI